MDGVQQQVWMHGRVRTTPVHSQQRTARCVWHRQTRYEDLVLMCMLALLGRQWQYGAVQQP
jgi:hypothetical protein